MQELLAEILAHPDDDQPRQIYADHLLEHGDPRGELIQVQIAREALADDDPAWAPLRRRELALLARHGDTWRAALGPQLEAEFRRGFVEELRGPIAELVRLGPSIRACEPVTVVEPINAGYWDQVALLASPLVAQVRELRLVGDLSRLPPDSWQALVGLDALRGLSLARTQPGAACLEALAASPLAGRLQRLDLTATRLDPPSLRILVDGRLATLERLSIAGSYPVADAVRDDRPWTLPALRALDVSSVALADDGIAALVRRLPALEELRAFRCRLDALGVAAIARGLPGVRRLVLGDNQLQLDGFAALEHLERLDLGSPHGTRLNLAMLLTGWPRLRRLSLAGHTLDRPEVLAGDGPLQRLTSLDLSSCRLGDHELKQLTSARWPVLHTLILRGNPDIGPYGARLLAEAADLPSLVHLDLRETGIVERGRRDLRARYRSGLSI